jgi:hypothetical protein
MAMSFRSRRIAELARERMLAAIALRQAGPESSPSSLATPRRGVVVAFSVVGGKRVAPAKPAVRSSPADAEEFAE